MPARSAPSSEASAGRGNRVLVDARRGGPGAARWAKHLEALAHRFLDVLRLRDAELSLSLVGDRAIHRLNREWRQVDRPTDVLSFPSGGAPGPGPTLLGDVVISMDTARRAARANGLRLGDELALYLAHGLLHLLGHDHHQPDEARVMARLERRLLGRAGMLLRAGEGLPATSRRGRGG